MHGIFNTTTPEHIAAVRQLLQQYGALRKLDNALGDFDKELQELPGEYASPKGALLVTYVDDTPAGCVAFRPLQGSICEMKRLFVPDEYKGRGIGRALAGEILRQARVAGYTHMRLDTHPWMEAAKKLYQSFGFKEIERYNNNPIAGIQFFEVKL